MIKKAVLLISASFLMLFSSLSFALPACFPDNSWRTDSRYTVRVDYTKSFPASSTSPASVHYGYKVFATYGNKDRIYNGSCRVERGGRYVSSDDEFDFYYNNPMGIPVKTDEECDSEFSGTSIKLSPSSVNYLNNGGSYLTAGGACSVSGSGGVSVCVGEGEENQCTMDLVATSTNEIGKMLDGESKPDLNLVNGQRSGDTTLDPSDSTLNNDYLSELPGECTASSCVKIGDKSYLVDWDSAPDWFEYVDNNGNTQRKPVSSTDPGGDTGGGSGGGDVPGGCFGDCYPGGGSGGDDGGNDSDGGSSGGGGSDNDTDGGSTGGGSTGGGSSGGGSGGGSSGGSGGGNSGGGSTGGGSSVPDFEFDDSDIIEAIGSSGESTQKGLDAVSKDVSKAIGEQTEETQGMFDGLGETITDALGLGTCYPNSKQTEDGNSAATSDQGLLGCIQKIADGMVGNIADKFTEEVGEGDDLFNTSGLDETLDGAAEQEQQYGDDVNSLMDEIGDGSSSGIADQVTSRLPSLPSGSCTPLQFGMMEISCQAHNTIKLWLGWIIYFWTVVSIVDTFFRSGQRTA